MHIKDNNFKFSPGRIVATRSIINILGETDINTSLRRHLSGDWGEICKEDWEANDIALIHGDRILSIYTSIGKVKFWIITESDRSFTTILLPTDY